MGRYKIPLDAYDMKPEGMIAYLRYNGWHFNKKMCDWAITLMRKTNATTGKLEKVEPTEKDTVEELLKVNNVKLENADNYDFVYVANMARADFFKSSLKDEAALAQFIKDMVDDPDQADGFIFNRFYADCNHNGIGKSSCLNRITSGHGRFQIFIFPENFNFNFENFGIAVWHGLTNISN